MTENARLQSPVISFSEAVTGERGVSFCSGYRLQTKKITETPLTLFLFRFDQASPFHRLLACFYEK